MSAESPPKVATSPALSWQEIGFLPLAGLDADAAASIVAATSRHVAAACRLMPPCRAITARELPGRGQLDADHLLAQLETAAAAGQGIVVGIAAQDLAIPVFTFVFGRATVGGRAALVSTARLRPEFHGDPPDPALVLQRSVAEVLHELGHVAGLGHCRDANCLMHFSSRVGAIDIRGIRFCAACRLRVPPALAGRNGDDPHLAIPNL